MIICSFSKCSEIVSGLHEVAMGVEHPETVSKLYIFPNIFKMKRLSCSPHSVHFAVGVTRHLKMFLAFSFFFNL